jgi:hypothetical protein
LKRTILFSLLVIGVAITLVTTGSTYSVFTDSSTGSTPGGDGINAATLDVLVNGDSDTAEATSTAADGDGQTTSFTFTLAGTDCVVDNLFPEVVCTRLATVGNGGSISLTYTADVWADDNGVDDGALGVTDDTTVACFDVALDLTGGAAPLYGAVDTADLSSAAGAPGANAYPTTDDTDLAPGELMQVRVSAVVDDDNACQAQTGYIIVTIQAEQSASPLD